MERFSLMLLDQFCYKFPNENFMISPFSVYHLLVLIAEGANGNTLKEISDKLEFGSLPRTRDFQQYLNEALK
jgi:serine protease inhibitor